MMRQDSDDENALQVDEILRRGLESLNKGNPGEAAKLAKTVLAKHPDFAAAHFLLALAAKSANRLHEASQSLARVTQLDPTDADAWAQAAEIFAILDDPDNAEAALRNAIENERGDAVVANTIAQALSALNKQAEAESWYEKAADARPDDQGVMVNLALCKMYLGDLAASQHLLSRVLEMDAANAYAHWLLAGIRKTEDDEHIGLMRDLIASGKLSPQSKAFLHYACGKEFEDLEDWDSAFPEFSAGAAAMRSIVHFNEDAEIRQYDAFRNAYTKEWLADGSSGYDDESTIFVVGQPRSGTTLIDRILSAHSQITSAGELKLFGNLCARLSRSKSSDRSAFEDVLQRIIPRELGESYVQGCTRYRGDARMVVDKFPSNYMSLPLILKALPRARIIHLHRHPMDNCFSVFKQLFAGAYPHSYDLAETARHYVRYHELMATWRERFGERFLEIGYEETVQAVPDSARRLVEFVGLHWEEGCVRFHEQQAVVATASVIQVRQPAHTRSIGRWRRYERQLQPVRDILDRARIPL